MKLLSVRRNPTPRLYVWWFGRWRRLHHGLTGSFLIAIGSVCCVHDWHDRWWLHE